MLLNRALVAALVINAGCAGAEDNRAWQPAGDAAAILASLPPLPVVLPDSRMPSIKHVTTQNGADAISMSAGAGVSGTELAINAGPGGLEYGIFALNFPTGLLVSVTANLAITSGSQVWIAVANYGTGSWQLAGPFAASGSAGFTSLAGLYRSPNGNACCAVIAFDGTSVNIATVSFTVDGVVLTYSISGMVTNSAGGGALSGVTLSCSPPVGPPVVSDASGMYVFDGLTDGVYTITPVLEGFTFTPSQQGAIVGPPATGINFVGTPLPPPVTYTGDIKLLLEDNCTVCHNAGYAAGKVILDTFADAVANATAANGEIQAGTMPPENPLDQTDKDLFQDWIDGGMPE